MPHGRHSYRRRRAPTMQIQPSRRARAALGSGLHCDDCSTLEVARLPLTRSGADDDRDVCRPCATTMGTVVRSPTNRYFVEACASQTERYHMSDLVFIAFDSE